MNEDRYIERGHVICPYCGMEQNVKGSIITMNVCLCNSEIGGCNLYFAFHLDKKIEARAFKIEGEEYE